MSFNYFCPSYRFIMMNRELWETCDDCCVLTFCRLSGSTTVSWCCVWLWSPIITNMANNSTTIEMLSDSLPYVFQTNCSVFVSSYKFSYCAGIRMEALLLSKWVNEIKFKWNYVLESYFLLFYTPAGCSVTTPTVIWTPTIHSLPTKTELFAFRFECYLHTNFCSNFLVYLFHVLECISEV